MPVLIDSLINILLKSPFQNQNLVLNWLSSLSFLFRRFLWLHKNGLMVLDILSNYSNQRHNKNNAFSGNSFYITNYKILVIFYKIYTEILSRSCRVPFHTNFVVRRIYYHILLPIENSNEDKFFSPEKICVQDSVGLALRSINTDRYHNDIVLIDLSPPIFETKTIKIQITIIVSIPDRDSAIKGVIKARNSSQLHLNTLRWIFSSNHYNTLIGMIG